MTCLDSLLSRLGYVKRSVVEAQAVILKNKLSISREKLERAVRANQPQQPKP